MASNHFKVALASTPETSSICKIPKVINKAHHNSDVIYDLGEVRTCEPNVGSSYSVHIINTSGK